MKYNYFARTKEGIIQTGTIEAVSQAAAIQALQAHQLVVIRIEPARQGPLLARKIKFFERVKDKELVLFSRQLAILISSDVPLVQSLKTLTQQTDNVYFEEVLFKISNDVEGGLIFSKALAKYPKIFSPLYINLIKSGEVAGQLKESLEYLADHLEKDYYLRSRVKGAMIYPAFILSTFIIIGIIMLITVVPQLISLLEETGQELPLPTKIFIGVSTFLRTWGWLIGIIFIGGLIAFWRWVMTPLGRDFWDKLILKLPIFGKILQQTYLARLAENLSTLIKGGLMIMQALTVTGEVVGNTVYRRIIFQARDEVRIGNTISSVLGKHPKQFPPLVIQMMQTGEKTGRIEFILKNLASFYTKEVDAIVGNLTQIIEPILIIALGLIVGGLVAAVLMPIYNLAGGL